MKTSIQPKDYRFVVFADEQAKFSFLTRSTAKSDETIKWTDGKEYPLVKMQISSASHPFFTGEEKIIDTEGRVDRFKARAVYAKIILMNTSYTTPPIPSAPQMPEPDNPLKGVLRLLVVAAVVFAGYSIYNSIKQEIEAGNLSFDSLFEDEYDYDDNEDDAVVATPLDAAISVYLNKKYDDDCIIASEKPDMIAPEGYHHALFSCKYIQDSLVYAYGKLDDYGNATDVHDSYLYSKNSKTVSSVARSVAKLYHRYTDVVIKNTSYFISSDYVTPDTEQNYFALLEKSDFVYNFEFQFPTNNVPSETAYARMEKMLAMEIPNYHLDYYELEYSADEIPERRVKDVDMTSLRSVDCKNRVVTVE